MKSYTSKNKNKKMIESFSRAWLLGAMLLALTIGVSCFGVEGYYINKWWNLPSGGYFVLTICLNYMKYRK